jgi:lipopolysaccharide export system protein LptA
MKKVSVVVLTLCAVAVFAASVFAADLPGQKLTQDELASITGKADPFAIPMSFFQNLSPSGTTVIVNGQKITPSSTVYTLEGITVTAGATFTK